MQISDVLGQFIDLPRKGALFLACNIVFYGASVVAGPNQVAVDHAIRDVCVSGAAGANLQTRCNAYTAAYPTILTPKDPIQTKILWATTATQSAASNTQSSEMNNNQIATINNRIVNLRNGRPGSRIQVSGTTVDANGNPVSLAQSTDRNVLGIGEQSRLGVFVNGNIGFGDRRLTDNELGYNQDTHGVTAGMDYRITDHFLLGTSFSYNNANARYFHNLPGAFGNMETDSYSGALYSSFFTDNGFFVDTIFSGTEANYNTNRKIAYTIPGDSVNTVAASKHQGNEFNIAMTSGYNFSKGGFTITPQLRVDYKNNSIDALNEVGGSGYGLHLNKQSFESLQTAAGLQLSYAISIPWGVITPMVRAEYIHEFENNSRTINAYFLEDSRQKRFNIITDTPDRDYIVASAGVSAQFAHGISAFVDYDTIQAHRYINNHSFSGGVRVEVPF